MAVPDFQSLMLPLLRVAADGKEHSLAETRPLLAAEFKLSAADQDELLPSGRQSRFANRVACYVEHIDPKVVLIDGRRLAELMIDFEVGVNMAGTYHVKRVDSDYFDEA